MTPGDKAPDPEELELSVFGPGIGECLVVHPGGGQWIVVDSCINYRTRQPVALEYLEQLGIDVARAVRLVIATHWHDDHVRGISQVLEAASSARFVCSGALRSDEWLQLVKLSSSFASIQTTSGISELRDVLGTIEQRRAPGASRSTAGPVWAVENRVLDQWQVSPGLDARILALSPCDGSVTRTHWEVAELLRQAEARRRLVRVSPNETSVVLWIQVGESRLLLGADLENGANPGTGWKAILAMTPAPQGQADVFKVPHHGSENAHHEDVWKRLLLPKPYAVVTPYASTPLPRPSDLRRLKELTPFLYCTAPPRSFRPPKRPPQVERMAELTARNRRAIETSVGQVRLRRHLVRPSGPFQIDLFGKAYPVT